MHKDSNSFTSFSDSGWSRDLGSGDCTERLVLWDESGPHYVLFLKELAALRGRADTAELQEAFDGHMAIGRALYEQQLYQEALASFQRASELQPTDARSHFHAGNSLCALRRHAEAREELLLALEAAEAGLNRWAHLLPQIHVNLGVSMEGEGMLLGACEHYREAAILCPTHFRALKLLGSALFGVGEYQDAKKALEEAVLLRPDYADARCDLGSVLHALGEDERAVQEFQKAIDLKPGHMDALYNLGGLFMDLGRFARAAEMYARVLTICPNHWQAQLNKAVSLLGAGEAEEARKALKEAFKMTKRVELYDAIAHLKKLKKKKKKKKKPLPNGNGDESFLLVDPSKFRMVGLESVARQDLADALEIRAFQKLTRLSCCNVDLLKKELNQNDVPISYSGSGAPEKSVQRVALEAIVHKMLHFLKGDMFEEAFKAINEKILSVMVASASARVDLGMFFAVLAPICSGPADERTRVAFDALLWRPNSEDKAEIRRCDAIAYIKLLRAVYIPSHDSSDMIEVHGMSDVSRISFHDFVGMFDDPDRGFGILHTLVKLEAGDRIRHGRHTCFMCQYPIVGSIFKEMRCSFNLCSRCYSEGKVPSNFKQEDYEFKEYGNLTEAMRDKCSCLNLHPETY
ncbi:putative TPR repeat-containing protein [Cocos nucifera]|uniref:Putative TPR repeat-containing protein n=1 Tax=Cocos nucifera TaxID=13894 RepID=A0A8K0IUI7_COCNU|nr:putative TPR repeat-containing protein [Cocos nucifera]